MLRVEICREGIDIDADDAGGDGDEVWGRRMEIVGVLAALLTVVVDMVPEREAMISELWMCVPGPAVWVFVEARD